MTIQEIVKVTGQLPSRAVTKEGITLESDVQPNGKLGFIATLWELKGSGYRERLVEYGTGATPEHAKESLKNKILKVK